MSSRLLIVGASVRALAESACRAGLEPIAIDQFADADLHDVASDVSRYNSLDELPELFARYPGIPWMYTGGLENAPQIVRQLGGTHTCFGNTADTLERVRDPFWLAELLASTGLPALQVARPGETNTDPNVEWLTKPLRSGGGIGIQLTRAAFAATTGRPAADPTSDCYLQEFRHGKACSALFRADQGGMTHLVGTATLLTATHDPDHPFLFGGAVTPCELPDTLQSTMLQIGQLVGKTAGLRGLFGCDFITDRNEIWLTEVNPRYTASVELYERARRINLVADHVGCFVGGTLNRDAQQMSGHKQHPREQRPVNQTQSSVPPRVVGKRVVYAPCDLVCDGNFSNALPGGLTRDRWWAESGTRLADRPRSGSRIPAGGPVCSILVTAATHDECMAGLGVAERQVQLWCHAQSGESH